MNKMDQDNENRIAQKLINSITKEYLKGNISAILCLAEIQRALKNSNIE